MIRLRSPGFDSQRSSFIMARAPNRNRQFCNELREGLNAGTSSSNWIVTDGFKRFCSGGKMGFIGPWKQAKAQRICLNLQEERPEQIIASQDRADVPFVPGVPTPADDNQILWKRQAIEHGGVPRIDPHHDMVCVRRVRSRTRGLIGAPSV